MSEQSERELAQAIRELRETVGGLQETVNRNTKAVDRLTGRMDKQEQATQALTKTMERVNVRLSSKLDAPELTGFTEATNQRLDRLERHLELV